MKGPCLTKCGLDVDYEPIEFSDGFVYYLPRNLDKTVHNCLMVSPEIIDLIYTCDSNEYPKDSDKSIYELFEKAKIVIGTSSSGSNLEAVSCGLSVIIVASQDNYTANPLVEKGSSALLQHNL